MDQPPCICPFCLRTGTGFVRLGMDSCRPFVTQPPEGQLGSLKVSHYHLVALIQITKTDGKFTETLLIVLTEL